jgi:AcrR family transcriptional regulator
MSARTNRGPSAAAENRAALISAARDVFASSGFDTPLSLIARKAGVGQGSLYRHFPDRVSLALAVFDDNIVGLEALAADPDATLDDILDEVIDQVTTSIAFIEAISPVTNDPQLIAMGERVRNMLAGKLDRSIRAGVTADELMLALTMVAALLSRTDEPSRPEVASRAWALLQRGLRA